MLLTAAVLFDILISKFPLNVPVCFLGEPVTFNLEIQPSKNYPVDFYILMDLSDSMHDDLNNLKELAVNICKLTNKRSYRLVALCAVLKVK